MTDKKDVKPSNIRSADGLIVAEENAKLGKPVPEQKAQKEPQEELETPPIEAESKTKSEEESASKDSEEQKEDKESQPDQDKEHEPEEDKSSSETSEDDEADEYGTKIMTGKKKLYTEEEVQRMIRERLARGKHAEQQQDVQQAAKDFTPDPESSESWETQLETFVEQTINKLSKKQTDAEWRQREEANQAEFEVKFSQGMNKYKDFSNVVAGKTITNAMMLATRSMKDPAAFLYAACKTQSKELTRIAQIQDPVTQAAEVGRLEERMKKARNLPSSPKPAKLITGDASDALPQLDIDARINQHAKSKIMR